MKETRKCIICPFGKFRCSPISKRKTCSTKCSRTYMDNRKKKYFKVQYTQEIKIVETIPQRVR